MILIIIPTCIIAAVLTHMLSKKHGPVWASALPSLIVSLLVYVFPDILPDKLSTSIPLAFIGATFVGMSTDKRLPNYYLTALAGFVFSLIYLNSSKIFAGFGGGLGTSACIATIIVIGAQHLLKNAAKVLGVQDA